MAPGTSSREDFSLVIDDRGDDGIAVRRWLVR